MIRLKLCLFIIFSSIVLTACERLNEFDVICGYFDALDQKVKVGGVTSDQSFSFINELVSNNLSEDSTARESWVAVMGFEPVEGRYDLFKEAAEVTLGADWQCPSMKSLLKTL